MKTRLSLPILIAACLTLVAITSCNDDKPAGRSPAPQNIGILLYKDLTGHYWVKYPEADITAIVLRYDLDTTTHYILE